VWSAKNIMNLKKSINSQYRSGILRRESGRALSTPIALGVLGFSLFISGCGQPADDMAKSGLSREEAFELAERSIDYDALIYNGFLPDADSPLPDTSMPPADLTTIRMGISWVANDQFAPWILGKELGFFEAEGIDLQIVEGGPGRDNLVNLIGEQIDVFIGAAEPVLQLLMSPTGSDVVMFGATMKGSSAGWVMLDKSIPKDQRSTKVITADDIRGKRVGIQNGAVFYTQFVCDQLGITPDEFTILIAGGTPDALISGAMDFFQCWIVNQPRILERAGYKNWVGVTFNDLGYESYNDISVVRRETFENQKPVLAAYTRGLARSMDYLVANLEESAEIVAKALDPVFELTAADIIWRMEREIPIYQGKVGERLLYMDPDKVKRIVALLIEYGQIDIKP
jgi:NitT/TauT family transport system substrate-binding protein